MSVTSPLKWGQPYMVAILQEWNVNALTVAERRHTHSWLEVEACTSRGLHMCSCRGHGALWDLPYSEVPSWWFSSHVVLWLCCGCILAEFKLLDYMDSKLPGGLPTSTFWRLALSVRCKNQTPSSWRLCQFPWGQGSCCPLGKGLSGFWVGGLVEVPAKQKTCPDSAHHSADKVSQCLQSQVLGVRDESDLIAEFKLPLDWRKNGWAARSLQSANHRSRVCQGGWELPRKAGLTASSCF